MIYVALLEESEDVPFHFYSGAAERLMRTPLNLSLILYPQIESDMFLSSQQLHVHHQQEPPGAGDAAFRDQQGNRTLQLSVVFRSSWLSVTEEQ